METPEPDVEARLKEIYAQLRDENFSASWAGWQGIVVELYNFVLSLQAQVRAAGETIRDYELNYEAAQDEIRWLTPEVKQLEADLAAAQERYAETRGLVRDLTRVLEKRNTNFASAQRVVVAAEAYRQCEEREPENSTALHLSWQRTIQVAEENLDSEIAAYRAREKETP